MLALLLALQVTAGQAPAAVPEAASVRLPPAGDARGGAPALGQPRPGLRARLGQIENAEWGRRAARLAFVIPSVTVGLDETKYSQDFFNPADPATADQHARRRARERELRAVQPAASSPSCRAPAPSWSRRGGRAGAALPGRARDRVGLLRRAGEPGAERVARERRRRAREGAGGGPGAGGIGRRGPDRLAPAGARGDPGASRSAPPAQRAHDRAARARAPGRGLRAGGRGAARHRARARAPALARRGGAARRSSRGRSTGRRGPASARRTPRSRSQRSDYLPTLTRRAALHQRYDTQIFPGRGQRQLGHLQPVVPALEQRQARDRGHPGAGEPRRGAGDSARTSSAPPGGT